MRLKSKTEKGSVLLAVVVISMMMMVIVAAGISMVGHTQDRTNREYREKQAYFLASSSLKGFVSEVTKYGNGGDPASVQANVAMLQGLVGKETDVQIQYTEGGIKELHEIFPRLNMGTGADCNCNCKIRIEEHGGPNSLKAIATANYLGGEAQVVAYFSIATPTAHAALSNALEFIGDTGGAEGAYNNLSVVGNTGAISTDSHDKNICYKFTDNNTRMNGTTDILGSFAVATQWGLGSNFNYKETDPLENAGCVLNVSRSALFLENQGFVRSRVQKARDYTGKPVYNYINTGEALMILGNYSASEPFCGGTGHEVDIYTSGLIIGGGYNNHYKFNDQPLKAALTNSFGTDPAALKENLPLKGVSGDSRNIFTCGSANNVYIYGNIYTYDGGNGFNGDISMKGTQTYIYGDIYCSGDIYLDTDLRMPISGTKIHMLSGKQIYKSAGGKHDGIDVVTDNWTTSKPNDRAERPVVKTATVQEYLHEPESFFMVDMGTTVDDTYQSMYKSNVPGDPNSMVLRDDIPYLDSNKPEATKQLRNGRGGSWYKFTINGTSYTPMFYITDSFVLGDYDRNVDNNGGSGFKYPDNDPSGKVFGSDDVNFPASGEGGRERHQIIFIDVDAAGKDICIIMQNGKTFNCDSMRFVIKNTPHSGKYDHFVYFCSDSGCGKVTYNPSSPSTNKTTPDYSTFRSAPNFRFDTKGSDTYVVSYELFKAIKSNKTADYVPGDSMTYMFVGKGGLIDISQNNFVFEGTIYAPKATVKIHKGMYLTINHYDDTGSKCYAVLGAVMCMNFKNDGNMSTIAYEPAAPNSLLPKIVKAVDLYDTGFKLNQYKSV